MLATVGTGGRDTGRKDFPISGVRLFTNMLSDFDGHYLKHKWFFKNFKVMSVKSRQYVR